MGKSTIEKIPFKFSYSLFKFEENYNYILKYKEVDAKGRYLYWDQFKYRIDKGDNAKIAWWATKLARVLKMKFLEYKDKNNQVFSFCIPNILQAKLYKISNFSSTGIVPDKDIRNRYLISSLVMEEAISSAQLEGASTTRRVAKEMLSTGRKPKNEDELMILNNYFLMQEVKYTKNEELTIGLILEYHKIATREDNTNGNVAGEFRKNNEIFIADSYDVVVHEPPCHKEIEERLINICEFANKEHSGEDGSIFIHPIVKAIILHFMIGYEHPFSDGNGRTARAIFYWYMLKNGFDFIEYVAISKFLKQAPTKYGKSFLYSETDENDLTYFIFYQVDIIIRAIDELLNYLEEKSREFEEVTELLSNSKIGNNLNFIQKDIVKKAIKNPGRIFTSKEIVSDYDKTANTARKYLNELVEYKILAIIKNGNTKDYIAPANIRDIFAYN